MREFICPPDHKHGEVGTCYTIHKCGCSGCREGNRVRARARSRAHLYGRYDDGLTDAEPVREHLAYLQASGLGWKRIAALSGLGNTAVASLIYGRKGSNADPRKGEVIKRTTRAKAAAILAVKPDLSLLAGGANVPSRGTVRRIQALVAMGWSQSKLADRLGMEPTNLPAMLQRPTVLARTHRAVEALFNELWDQTPPNSEWRDKIAYSRSLSYAKKHRWLSPLAWDDIDNDPTPAMVDDIGGIDEIAVEMAMAGERVRLSPAERREAIRRLHADRWSDRRIAEALGCADRTVWRIREELGLESFEYAELRKAGAA